MQDTNINDEKLLKKLYMSYGISCEDTRNLGTKHIAVSLDGETPFFTVAVEDLDEI